MIYLVQYSVPELFHIPFKSASVFWKFEFALQERIGDWQILTPRHFYVAQINMESEVGVSRKNKHDRHTERFREAGP
jgi:hypothetical protein